MDAPSLLSRRQWLRASMAGGLAVGLPGCVTEGRNHQSEARRGVVLIPEDLSLEDWPERAAAAGLNTIALHHQNSPQAVVRFIQSKAGERFLSNCRKCGLDIEYELHALKELLSRELFSHNPAFFRMNEQGQRVADANLCIDNKQALQIIGDNALALAGKLTPTTGRYFLWSDDGGPWCRCPKCRNLSASEQALVLENYLVARLQSLHRHAQLAHLAYANTLRAPRQVKPDPGVFLEYAPINRRYDIPYQAQAGAGASDGLSHLDENLEVFRPETSQVLEYWLDVSRFSKWRRPAVELPWNPEVFRADVKMYRSRGIRHITTFAVWIDADYQRNFGGLEVLEEYGAGLNNPGSDRMRTNPRPH